MIDKSVYIPGIFRESVYHSGRQVKPDIVGSLLEAD